MKLIIKFNKKGSWNELKKKENKISKKYNTLTYSIKNCDNQKAILNIDHESDLYKFLNTILWIDDIIHHDNSKKIDFSIFINPNKNDFKLEDENKIFWYKPLPKVKKILNNDTRYKELKCNKENTIAFHYNFYSPLQYSKKIKLKTLYGDVQMQVAKHMVAGKERIYTIYWKGNLKNSYNIPLRIHYKCETSEIFDSVHCDCREQLESIKQKIFQNEKGMIIYSHDEGRGAGIFNKINAYHNTQKFGDDTVVAFKRDGLKVEQRCFRGPADIIKKFKINSVNISTNNFLKIQPLNDLRINVSRVDDWITNLSTEATNYQVSKIAKTMHIKQKSFILITGALGFIGKATAKKMILKNQPVILLDKKPNNYFEENENVVFIQSDLTINDLQLKLAKYKIKSILHLAGQSGVRSKDREQFYLNNIVATKNLINFMKKRNINNIVFASTSSIYGNIMPAGTKPFKISEKTKIDINKIKSIYAKTKYKCEKELMKSGLNYNILRYFTVYGPGQRTNMAIHKFIASALSGKVLEVYGDGNSFRDYTHIEDVVKANILAINSFKTKTKNIFNICSGEKIKINDLINIIKEHLNKKINYENKAYNSFDVYGTWGSNKKAKKILDWKPKKNFKNSIKEIINTESKKLLFFTDIKDLETFKKIYDSYPHYKYIGFDNSKINNYIYKLPNLKIYKKIKDKIYRYNSLIWIINKKYKEYKKYFLKNAFLKNDIVEIKKPNQPIIFHKGYNQKHIKKSISNFNNNLDIVEYLEKLKFDIKNSTQRRIQTKINLIRNVNKDLKYNINSIIAMGNEGLIIREAKNIIKVILKDTFENPTGIQEHLKNKNINLRKKDLNSIGKNKILPNFKIIKNKKYYIFKYLDNITPVIHKIEFFNIFSILYQQRQLNILIDDLKLENFGVIEDKNNSFNNLIIYNDIGRGIYQWDSAGDEMVKGIIRDYLIFYNYHFANILRQKLKKARELKKQDLISTYPITKNIKLLYEILNNKIIIFNSINYKKNKNIIDECICSLGISKFLKKYKNKLKNKYIKICHFDSKDTLTYKKLVTNKILWKMRSSDYKVTKCKEINKEKLTTLLQKKRITIVEKTDNSTYKLFKDKICKAKDYELWKLK